MDDARYWLDLNPDLHIDKISAVDPGTIDFVDQDKSRCQDLLKTEGYVHVEVPDWKIDLEALARAMSRVTSQGLPATWVFVYDEFWLMFYRLHDFLAGVLGPGYLRLPNFWAWHIDHQRSQAGWRPHRDHGRETLNADGSPRSVTVWIPLTDSMPINGCLYIVPASRDPTYATTDENTWRFDLADIRALPARAGSFLCWNQAVLHWGSRSSPQAPHDRISISMEFQQANIEAINQPVSSPGDFPEFRTRLALIQQQIQQYSHISG